ncbi:hypothetical protein [Kitasatospora sp. CB01950]|uniref:hypothetical protein n=1 Tax=Kitasatospora sp. CB01950 TaxID=1703930 RepID=UPI00093CABFF|nr:hypothetical protein [Kitasatospora sp. CB01950]OKI95074.1 hypothetical protein AMK19_32910 [Kitasatospora sp. CB01950]
MPWTKKAAAQLATELSAAAATQASAAKEGRLAAATSTDPLTRAQNTAAARLLSEQATDLHATAAAIRDGDDPDSLGYADSHRFYH